MPNPRLQAHNWLVCKDSAEVNMNRHPLWGRNPETFGEDPHLTATMGEAFTQQLQQPNRSSSFVRTTSVTRHLVVYSGTAMFLLAMFSIFRLL